MFKQFNFDILGEDSPYADLEIFNIIVDIFSEFGATPEQFQIYYNSRRFIDSVLNIILKISREKLPLVYKALDNSNKFEEAEFENLLNEIFQDKIIIEGIIQLKNGKSMDGVLKQLDGIPEGYYDSKGYLELVKFEKLLMEAGLSDYCTFSSSTVRGLDYYTGIIYEVFDTGKENIRSIFGGGRYDDLLTLYSDEKITGTGFGMGVHTLSLFLKSYELILEDIKEKDYSDTIYIASINEDVSIYAIELSRIIRGEDFPCIIDYRFKNLKNQLKRANELGVFITLIVGPDEKEKNKVTIKNMISEEQKIILFDNLIDEIYRILDDYEESETEQ